MLGLDMFNLTSVMVELMVADALFARRLPRRRSFVARAAGCAAASLAGGAAGALALMVLPQPVVFVALFGLSYALVRLLFDVSRRLALTVCVCGYLVQHSASAIVWIVWDAFGLEQSLNWDTPLLWLAGEATRVAVFCITYALAYVLLTRRMDVTRVTMSPRALAALTLAMLLVTVALSDYTSTRVVETHTRMALRAISLLTCLMMLLMMRELAQHRALADEVTFLRHMNDLRSDYYAMLKDDIERTNIRYHDLKHQIMRLRAIDSEHDIQACAARRNAVLDELSASAATYDDIAKTGNPALDVVLTQKSLECREKHITLTYMVDAACVEWIADRDIYALFGNILDNAIEASERITDPGRRVIKLTASLRGSLVNIHASNYFDRIARTDGGDLLTTKPDASAHGYGLKSIRMIIADLGGALTINTDDGIFDLSIVLPRP